MVTSDTRATGLPWTRLRCRSRGLVAQDLVGQPGEPPLTRAQCSAALGRRHVAGANLPGSDLRMRTNEPLGIHLVCRAVERPGTDVVAVMSQLLHHPCAVN